jgi:hypothetical protein
MGSKPPKITVRFFAEANARDGGSFASPYKMTNPPGDIYLQKVPAIHEKQISSIFPFRAADGSWGCAFRLDNDGRINLEVVSNERRGKALIGFIGTSRGTHPAVEMIIDRNVPDGVISIPRGLTDMEISVLAKEFKVSGGERPPSFKEPSRGWNPFKKKPAAEPAPAPMVPALQ